ncbi:Polyisoprenoid-binding protein YceI [Chryseolinea serpens]|uniref:Polyisoprenoid-binding protein YceI n=1 Tax=Chryseolinea serpens TaxID=947013 RepID=A0A1M5XUG8_9BACT|nr:YceI family protein [Chryseolinea serpens]SHI03178.1 Polyisoprenoid-binding protein YceI [Chryseolinea serpens]
MRNKLFKFGALGVMAFAAFSFAERPAVQAYKVNPKESSLQWKGKKVTGEHSGKINLASGSLNWDGKTLKGGNFDIDVTSITVTDITDAETNAKLLGHLKSDDFFGVEKFPKASFVITSATPTGDNSYLVKGKLTIKSIVNDVEFPAQVKAEGKKVTATAKITVDRTKYDIKFRSTNFFENLGDKAIANDFELDVKLVASSSDGV